MDYDGPWSLVDSEDGYRACRWAFDLAASADAALLVVAGGALPSAEMVSHLLEAFELDPLFGVAVPRFACHETGRLRLHCQFGPSTDTAPLRVLASLPDYQVVTECAAPVMMVRRELVGSLSIGEPATPGLWAAMVDYAVRARRAGFRTVVCNRAIASFGGTEPVPWGCSPGARPPSGGRGRSSGGSKPSTSVRLNVPPSGCWRRRSTIHARCCWTHGT